MFIELTCTCVASFQFESEDESNLALMWAQQFVDAHRVCGFVANTKVDKPETLKRFDVPTNRKIKQDGIEDDGVSV